MDLVRLKLKKGQKFEYSWSEEKKYTQNVASVIFSSFTLTKFSISYEVAKSSDQNYIILSRLDSLVEDEHETSSDDVVKSPSEVDIEGIKEKEKNKKLVELFYDTVLSGCKFELIVSPNGRIENLNSLNSIDDKLKQLVKGYSHADRNYLQHFREVFSELYLKKIFQKGLQILPDKPFVSGISWQQMEACLDQYPFISNHRINKIDGCIGFIDKDAVVDNPNSGMYGLKGKGMQKGWYQIDLKTGMLLNDGSTLEIEDNEEKGSETSFIQKITGIGREIQ